MEEKNMEAIVVLAILQLHKDKKEINLNNIRSYIASLVDVCISEDDIENYIDKLILHGHISDINGKISVSMNVLHYYIEILQYGNDINETLNLLYKRIDRNSSERI